jgi:hypothetical protein
MAGGRAPRAAHEPHVIILIKLLLITTPMWFILLRLEEIDHDHL